MKDFTDRDPVSVRNIFIGGLVILLAGLIAILILFAGGAPVDADTPVYDNGTLKTTFTYGDTTPRDVWIQYSIFKQDNLFTSTEIGSARSFALTFTKGNTLSECPVQLEPGEYKIFIYVLSREDGATGRIAGFIRNIEVI